MIMVWTLHLGCLCLLVMQHRLISPAHLLCGFMDGTFNSCPSLFQHLYVVRATLGESYVSCVYAFLSNKDQSTYEELLSAIVDKCADLRFQPDLSASI